MSEAKKQKTMSENPHHLEDRKLLHDLATPLTVLKLALKKLKAVDREGMDPTQQEATLEILERAFRSLESLEDIHADFKKKLSARESE